MREARGVAVVLAVLLGIVVVSAGAMGAMIGGPVMGPGMMWGSSNQGWTPGMSGWGAGLLMGLGGLMMLAFWAAVMLGIVLLVKWVGGVTPHGRAPDDPLTVLQRRYAAGEIDQETYQRIRAEILRDETSSPTNLRRAS